MNGDGFALLWGKILRSSIWIKESKETRLVWVTLLALKNHEGKIWSSVVGLADSAKVSVEECREALRIFLSPDPDDTSKVEDGRRIREMPGGWEIVNHDLYRFSTEAKREFWRQQKADQRARLPAKMPRRGRSKKPDTGMDGTPASQSYKNIETASIAAAENGNTEEAERLNHAPITERIPSELE